MPPSLRQRMADAMATYGRGAGVSLPQQLRIVADALLEEAKRGGTGRDTALTLLAADALVTYSCELTAEIAPEKLGELR